MVDRKNLPLVYSCSGCSSAAQTSNDVALELNRRGLAEMSCIAGVGGDVPKLVKLARSGRPIVAIDGCVLACVKSTLARHGVEPTAWHQLRRYDVAKVYGAEPDQANVERVLDIIIGSLPASGVATSR